MYLRENPQVVVFIVLIFVEGFVPGLDCHTIAAVFNPILKWKNTDDKVAVPIYLV